MRIIITESQFNLLMEGTPLTDDEDFRQTIKGYENEVTNSSGKHYVFDDKDPKNPKTFVNAPSKTRGGTLTIGWGHTGPEAKIGNTITKSKAEQLLTSDIQKEENKTKNLFPKYDNYPLYVRKALVNSVYRGEAKKDYKWVEAINAGNWNDGATKYLQGWNIDFTQAKNPKYKGGVADRMVTNQEAFKKYANELKTKKPVNNSLEKGVVWSKEKCLSQLISGLDMYKMSQHPECNKYFTPNKKISKETDKTLNSKPINSYDVFYTVKSGDSLSKIAAKYDKTVTVETIKKLNNLKSDSIKIGQKLKIK